MTGELSQSIILRRWRGYHEQLASTLATLDDEQIMTIVVDDYDDWTIKDIVAHITAWDRQLITWLTMTKEGNAPEMPKDKAWGHFIPQFNHNQYLLYKDTPIKTVLEQYEVMFEQVVTLIADAPDTTDAPFWVLFADGVDPWRTLMPWVDHIKNHHANIKQTLGLATE